MARISHFKSDIRPGMSNIVHAQQPRAWGRMALTQVGLCELSLSADAP